VPEEEEILDTFQGEVPVVSCLEGGYDTEVIAKCSVQCAKAVLGQPLELEVPESFVRRAAAVAAV